MVSNRMQFMSRLDSDNIVGHKKDNDINYLPESLHNIPYHTLYLHDINSILGTALASTRVPVGIGSQDASTPIPPFGRTRDTALFISKPQHIAPNYQPKLI